ncbi:Protein CURVATURE THYLAKOID 1B, chloroplastic, partial [Mucuna pruriens]
MASTSSSTLSVSSSSTLVDAKAPRQSPTSSPQCVTLPPPPVQSSTWKTTAFCKSITKSFSTAFCNSITKSFSTAFCRKFARNVMAMATTREAPAAEITITELTVGEPPEIVKTIQEAWDKVEDKYAVSSLAVAGVVALWGAAGVISNCFGTTDDTLRMHLAIDRLPLIPGLLEIVGIGYTGFPCIPGWFAYNNFVFRPDREAFLRK